MNKRICSVFLTFLFYAASPVILHAGEIERLYNGIRPLGMGNAFITLSDDANALFHNPAGLNDRKGGGVSILNPSVDVSKSSIDLVSRAQEIDDSGTDTEQLAEITDFLTDIVGENQHVRGSIFPNITMHNFSVGALGSGALDIMVRNRSMPEVNASMRADYGAVGGFAFPLYKDVLAMGISGKYIFRQGLSETYDAQDILENNFDVLTGLEESVSDFSFDVGWKLKGDTTLKPSLGIVVQNITDLDFSEKELGLIPQTVNVGVGIQPKFWNIETAVVVELDDVTKEVTEDMYKRLHIGGELKFPYLLALRGGINQGWFGFGASINLWILKLDYANYAEEIGVVAGQKKDRRHAVQLALGWNM